MTSSLQITFNPVREQNIGQLKVLNQAIFPIKYQVQVEHASLAIEADTPVNIVCKGHSNTPRHFAPQDRIYQHILASGDVSQLGPTCSDKASTTNVC